MFRTRRILGNDWTISRGEKRLSFWAHTPPPQERQFFDLEFQWGNWGGWHFGFSFGAYENRLNLRLDFINSLWMHITWPALAKLIQRIPRVWYDWGREVELVLTLRESYSGGPHLSWNWGGHVINDDKRSGRWYLYDWLFGRVKFAKRTLDSGTTEIVMPEGRYPATWEIEEYQHWRPRWPFRKTRQSIDFEIEGGIPIPGKGENSWDIDDDAIFATGCEWHEGKSEVRPCAHKVALRVLETRNRYACLDWRPIKGWAFTPEAEHV